MAAKRAKDAKPGRARAKPKKSRRPTATERKAKAAGARGKRLSAAKQQLRDSLIYQRYLQRWPRKAIAEEAGIAERTVDDVIAQRRKVGVDLMNIDPVALVEDILGGFMASAGDFEKMAHAAFETHPSAAVGARKAADEARSRAIAILQDTGRFPKELGTLRHLIDLRAIAGDMLVVMQRFQRGEADAEEVMAVFLKASKLEALPTVPDEAPQLATSPPIDDG